MWVWVCVRERDVICYTSSDEGSRNIRNIGKLVVSIFSLYDKFSTQNIIKLMWSGFINLQKNDGVLFLIISDYH